MVECLILKKYHLGMICTTVQANSCFVGKNAPQSIFKVHIFFSNFTARQFFPGNITNRIWLFWIIKLLIHVEFVCMFLWKKVPRTELVIVQGSAKIDELRTDIYRDINRQINVENGEKESGHELPNIEWIFCAGCRYSFAFEGQCQVKLWLILPNSFGRSFSNLFHAWPIPFPRIHSNNTTSHPIRHK